MSPLCYFRIFIIAFIIVPSPIINSKVAIILSTMFLPPFHVYIIPHNLVVVKSFPKKIVKKGEIYFSPLTMELSFSRSSFSTHGRG